MKGKKYTHTHTRTHFSKCVRVCVCVYLGGKNVEVCACCVYLLKYVGAF